MPIYEYRCEKGHQFEAMQKFSDAPLTSCETCGSPVKKLISNTAFILKGSGWYVTDYAKKNISPRSEEPSSDTKPAETASPAPSGGEGASGSSSGSSGSSSES